MYLNNNKIKAWFQALRVPFFITSLFQPLLAYILALQTTTPPLKLDFCLLLLGIVCMHGATNLSNDLFDNLQGIDTPTSTGGSRVVQQGKINLKELAWGSALFYLLSFAFFLALTITTQRLWLMPVWLFGLFSSYFYVAPPIRYGYHALGELFVFINMGYILLLGSYIALCGQFSWTAFWLSLPFGIISAGVLFFQGLPEIETDALGGKRTLVGTLGKKNAVKVFTLLWPVLLIICLTFWLTGIINWPVLGVLLSLPFYFKLLPLLNQSLSTDSWPWLKKHEHLLGILCLIVSVSLVLSVL